MYFSRYSTIHCNENWSRSLLCYTLQNGEHGPDYTGDNVLVFQNALIDRRNVAISTSTWITKIDDESFAMDQLGANTLKDNQEAINNFILVGHDSLFRDFHGKTLCYASITSSPKHSS